MKKLTSPREWAAALCRPLSWAGSVCGVREPRVALRSTLGFILVACSAGLQTGVDTNG